MFIIIYSKSVDLKVVGNNGPEKLVFDKESGKFIVTVTMTPEEYGCFAHEKPIADFNSVVYDKQLELFVVPIYMSPAE